MLEKSGSYLVKLAIDFPGRKLNRVTSFFRLFTLIPIVIILGLLISSSAQGNGSDAWRWEYAAGGFVFLPIVLMLLFCRKYPRWWFDWNISLTRFAYRVYAYAALLRDEYPSTDEDQAVHIEIPYPDAQKDLKRWLPLFKWLLAIPHYIILLFVGIAGLAMLVVAWFAILFTGKYPGGLFEFVVGVYRWSLRVSAYAFLLTTDKYPPFRLTD